MFFEQSQILSVKGIRRVTELVSPSETKKFIQFPHLLYKNNPYWVPPLDIDLRERINPAKNPFLKYGRIKLFLAMDEKDNVLGRIAAVINPVHNNLYKDNTGFFGLFECINDLAAANLLFNSAKKWLKDKGLTGILGPVNFNTNEECGVLVENFSESPMIMCNYSYPYYDALIKSCGLVKEMDLISYKGYAGHIYPEKYHEVFNRASINPNISFRTLEKKNLDHDRKILMDIYNGSFKNVWGYVPFTDEESLTMAKTFTQFYDQNLVWICYYKDTPVGFILALPDINEVLKKLHGSLYPFGIIKFLLYKNRLNTIRVLTLAVLPEYRHLGIEILLINKVHSRMKTKGYQKAELSVVMETNYNMRKVLENLGFTITKRYRLYKGAIE